MATVIATDEYNAADGTAWSSHRASNYVEYDPIDPAYLKIANDGTISRLVAAFGMLTPGPLIARWAGAVSPAATDDLGAILTIRALGSTDGRFYAGPMARMSAGTGTTVNGYALKWYDGIAPAGTGTPQTLDLVKFANSVPTVLKSITRTFVNPTALGLIPVGQRLGIEIDGVEIDSFTDTGGYSTGGAGLIYLGAASTAGPEIDRLQIANAGSGGGPAPSTRGALVSSPQQLGRFHYGIKR